MAPNPRRLDQRLQSEVYDLIPALECRGVCSDSCGPIGMSVRERQRMERQAGRRVECGAGATCSMLTADRRCGVYDMRPVLCRLWGVLESLPCPYGCRPERTLTDKEGWELLLRAEQIGGSDEFGKRELADMVDRVRSIDPEIAKRIARDVTVRPTVDGRGGIPKSVIER